MHRTIVVLLASLFLAACATTQPELVLTNGKVFTADDGRPWAEAVAIGGDRILRVGTTAEIGALAGARTTRIDLGGRVVVPGINDAHVHEPWGSSTKSVKAPPRATPEQVLNAVRDAVAVEPAGTWLTASIAPELQDDPAWTRAALDAIAPRHPVSLHSLGGHARLLNTAALRAWNIGDGDPDPKGGRYGRADGRLNGWVYEHALWVNDARAVAALPDDTLVSSMREFAQEAMRFGITSVQSMPLMSNNRAQRLEKQADVPLRWRWMEFQLGGVQARPTHTVKYVLDGTPIERGAALRAPWVDRPQWSGALNYTDADMRTMLEAAAQSDAQLVLHISGDLPLQKLFALMQDVPANWPAKRLRIEHGDFMGGFLDEGARFQTVHVINPSHMMLPQLFAQRLDPARLKTFAAARSVLARGIPLAIGSDGPINPWLNVMFATMNPANPAEALTREQAILAYTRGSAFAERMETQKGSLTPGKLADLAVLSQDVFTVAPPELSKTQSVLTIIGGKIVLREGL
ncbi:MAG TPA: amidohydrolase family protein [Thermoanaerobaculia bacterium]|nr:amidohydrolase family protein [Thermoanaerobaculia bacterium]